MPISNWSNKNFSEIKTEVCKFNICTKWYSNGYNQNNLINFISAENHNIKSVSIPKQKYRT